jgi:AraC family transcriptional activator of pobA
LLDRFPLGGGKAVAVKQSGSAGEMVPIGAYRGEYGVKEKKSSVPILHPSMSSNGILTTPAYLLYGEDRTGAIFGFFHIESLTVRTIPDKWQVGLHRHPDFDQLLILFEGRCVFVHDGREAAVEANSCVYTPANVVHQFAYQPGSKGVVISVSSDFVAGLSSAEEGAVTAMLRLGAQRVFALTKKDAVAATHDLVKLMLDKFASRHPNRDILRYMFGVLLLELVTLIEAPSNGSLRTVSAVELFRQYRDLIQATIGAIGFNESPQTQSHTVEAFAARLSTTPYALNVACQSMCGSSARDLIHTAILEQATRLLLYTARPMKDISFLLGYSHASHFTRFFKQRRGITPEAFRTKAPRDTWVQLSV